MLNRIANVLSPAEMKKLSPWGKINEKKSVVQGRELTSYDIKGIQHLDYMILFKKFTFTPQESYKLDHIAKFVLGDKKLDYSHIGTLGELYDLDFDTYLAYNIIDVELLQRMDEELNLLPLVYSMAYYSGSNMVDTLGTVNIWDNIIFRYLSSRNIAVPQADRASERGSFGGGYVKEPIPGRYNWVASFDLNSLYPNIIIQNNISPETLVASESHRHDLIDALANASIDSVGTNPDLAYSAASIAFRKDKVGFLPALMDELYKMRKSTKGEMIECQKRIQTMKNGKDKTELKTKAKILDTSQHAFKILLNSCFGATANPYFRYYDLRLAESITFTGQAIIRRTANALNTYLQSLMGDKVDRICAIDTDSNYVVLDDLVKRFKPKNPLEFIDQICKDKLEPVIENALEDIGRAMNVSNPKHHVMKREVIADTSIWTAKKRYMMNVLDSEGIRFKEPKLKMMGIEAIKSSTPAICREEMKDLIKTILQGTETDVHNKIAAFQKVFNAASLEDIAIPRGVTAVEKYVLPSAATGCKRGTPINSRAAIVYNNLIKSKGLADRYQLIQSGDKIKYLYMHAPNPYNGTHVIGFPLSVPDELRNELRKYVDFETQFAKAFMAPIVMILDAVKWSAAPRASLEDFF
jgi:DNA polymerase elongation subunit (family B)